MTTKLYLKHPKNSTGELRKDEVSIIAKIKKDERNQFEVPTGERIIPKYWDFKNQSVKASHVDHSSMNLELSKFKVRVMSLYRENRDKSFSEYKDLIRGNREKKTVDEAFKEWLKVYSDKATIKNNKTTLNKLQKMPGWQNSFEIFDAGFPQKIRAKYTEIQDTYFYRIISRLKTFLKWAEEKGYATGTAYKKWKVRVINLQPLAFTEDEINQLAQAPLVGKLALARDYFLVSCRTSLRISDLVQIDSKFLEENSITIRTKKGEAIGRSKEIDVLFTPGSWGAPALDILQSYGGKLPAPEKSINDDLRAACEAAKIYTICRKDSSKNDKKVTTEFRKCDVVTMHWGRKTCITLMLEKGVPLKNVAEMAGNTMTIIEKHYAAKSSKKVNEGYLKQMVKTA